MPNFALTNKGVLSVSLAPPVSTVIGLSHDCRSARATWRRSSVACAANFMAGELQQEVPNDLFVRRELIRAMPRLSTKSASDGRCQNGPTGDNGSTGFHLSRFPRQRSPAGQALARSSTRSADASTGNIESKRLLCRTRDWLRRFRLCSGSLALDGHLKRAT